MPKGIEESPDSIIRTQNTTGTLGMNDESGVMGREEG